MMDYYMCSWPPPLTVKDDSIARHFDAMNEAADGGAHRKHIEAIRAAHPDAPLITCSHFVPRIELTPEKRYRRARTTR